MKLLPPLLFCVSFLFLISPISQAQIIPVQDSVITSIVTKVNADSVKYIIQSLQNFQTRYLKATNRFTIANWIKDRFVSYGFTDVKLDSFMCTNTYGGTATTLQVNVVATLPGTDYSDQIYIVGGHYDSFSSGNPLTSAPGADDNASGTAAVLETARTIMASGFQPKASLRFIAFAAEELMLYGDSGCEYYAEKAFNSGMNIKLMINADMISYTSKPLAESRVSINYYTGHTNLLNLAKEVTSQFTSITPVNGSLNQYSDSYPFYQKGYPAVYFEENDFSPFYHTVNDVITNYNMPYCTEVIKAVGATLLKKLLMDHPVPVELILFEGVSVNGGVRLNWITSTEANNFGFEIERASSYLKWQTIGFVSGKGTTTEKNHYTFIDKILPQDAQLYYRLKQLDYNGNFEYTDNIEISMAPDDFLLQQNYPNPFNPLTIINFSIPVDSKVILELSDVTGQIIATLVNKDLAPGYYSEVVSIDQYGLASGIYIYRIKAVDNLTGNNFVSSKKMMLLK
jgi:hypothetical protein